MELEVTICTLDDQPIEISPCFKTLVEQIGLQDAANWTKVIDVPIGKDDT
jgi:hypothetical protein